MISYVFLYSCFYHNDDVGIMEIMGFTCGRNGFEGKQRVSWNNFVKRKSSVVMALWFSPRFFAISNNFFFFCCPKLLLTLSSIGSSPPP